MFLFLNRLLNSVIELRRVLTARTRFENRGLLSRLERWGNRSDSRLEIFGVGVWRSGGLARSAPLQRRI